MKPARLGMQSKIRRRSLPAPALIRTASTPIPPRRSDATTTPSSYIHAAFAHWLKHKMKVPKWLWKALLWLRSSRLVKAIRATLPRKPTRLFIFDISFDAIEHDPSYRKRRGFLGKFVLLPSGWWRVLFAYCLLTAACIDVFLVSTSMAYCKRPYFGPPNLVITILFAIEMALGFCTAYPTKDASLEMRPKMIALQYLRTSFFLELPGLLPLERLSDASTDEFAAAVEASLQ